jgi:hypothetical protein
MPAPNAVEAILAITTLAVPVEGAVESLVTLIATLHAGGALTDEQVQQIRDDATLADVNYDAAIAAAKARLGK